MVSYPRASLGARDLRPLNVPVRIEIHTNANGDPETVRRQSWSSARAIDRVQDCWRIDDEWWRERPLARRYYTLLLTDGVLLTVYHDLIASQWFEQK